MAVPEDEEEGVARRPEIGPPEGIEFRHLPKFLSSIGIHISAKALFLGVKRAGFEFMGRGLSRREISRCRMSRRDIERVVYLCTGVSYSKWLDFWGRRVEGGTTHPVAGPLLHDRLPVADQSTPFYAAIDLEDIESPKLLRDFDHGVTYLTSKEVVASAWDISWCSKRQPTIFRYHLMRVCDSGVYSPSNAFLPRQFNLTLCVAMVLKEDRLTAVKVPSEEFPSWSEGAGRDPLRPMTAAFCLNERAGILAATDYLCNERGSSFGWYRLSAPRIVIPGSLRYKEREGRAIGRPGITKREVVNWCATMASERSTPP